MMNKQYSESEAQRIFALAAERQQQSESPQKNRLTLEDLEEAGLAAGIAPEFIKSAAADLFRPDRLPVYQTFLGTPALIRRSRIFFNHTATNVWEALLPLVQETFSTDGETSTLREGYLWVSTSEEKKWPIKMLVESEKEGTRVTLERDRVDQLRGNYIGASLFMIVALVIMTMGLISGATEEVIASLIFVTISVVIGGGTWLGYMLQGRREVVSFDQIIESASQLFADDKSLNEEAINLDDLLTGEENNIIEPIPYNKNRTQ